MLCSNLQFYCS